VEECEQIIIRIEEINVKHDVGWMAAEGLGDHENAIDLRTVWANMIIYYSLW
jgi:hypothetical protein